MLVLNERDINSTVILTELIDAVEDTLRFYESGDFFMPVRFHLDYQGATLLLMPCFTRKIYGTKLVSLFPENPAKGKPMINANMLLNDGDTGETIAMLDGRVLTALRTGAVGGAGVRCFSKKEQHGLGIVGAGVQGFQQARFAASCGSIGSIRVFDAIKDNADSFVSRLRRELPDMEISAAESIEELLEKSETVITATTSKQPVLPDNEELLKGKSYIGIGSYKPEMREYPDALFNLIDHIYVDTTHALEESGDIIDPIKNGWIKKENVKTLGGLLVSGEKPAENDRRTTLYKSVGMALFDVMISQLIYHKALKEGLGQEVDF